MTAKEAAEVATKRALGNILNGIKFRAERGIREILLTTKETYCGQFLGCNKIFEFTDFELEELRKLGYSIHIEKIIKKDFLFFNRQEFKHVKITW